MYTQKFLERKIRGFHCKLAGPEIFTLKKKQWVKENMKIVNNYMYKDHIIKFTLIVSGVYPLMRNGHTQVSIMRESWWP